MADQYTKVFLPFDNNTTYDECGNLWNIVGSPVIKNTENLDKGRFKTALYLNGSSYLVCNNVPIKDFNIDFTLDFWYYIPSANCDRWKCTVSIVGETGNHFDGIAIWEENPAGQKIYPGMLYCIHGTAIDGGTLYEPNGSTNYDNGWDVVHAQLPYYKDVWVHTVIIKQQYSYKLFINGSLDYEHITNRVFLGAKKYYIGFWGTVGTGDSKFIGYIKNVRLSNCARWDKGYDMNNITYSEQYTEPTKRSVHKLYQFSYQSLYNYNINTKINTNVIRKINNDIYLDNIAYRYILHNINIFYHTKRSIIGLSNTLFNYALSRNIFNNIILINKIKYNMLLNIFPIFNINRIISNNLDEIFLNLKRIINKNKMELQDLKRLVKKKYTNIKWKFNRLIHNNINIINYIYRKKVCNSNNANDTVRSVTSYKKKIMVFVINTKYKLR